MGDYMKAKPAILFVVFFALPLKLDAQGPLTGKNETDQILESLRPEIDKKGTTEKRVYIACLVQNREYKTARRFFNDHLAKITDDVPLQMALYRVLTALGDDNEAFKILKKLQELKITTRPIDSLIAYYVGVKFLGIEATDSLSMFREAITLDKLNPRPYLELGKLQSKKEERLDSFASALLLAESSSDTAKFALGFVKALVKGK